jgi:hypothetical protein
MKDKGEVAMETHSGSCLCSAVKFEVTGSFESFFLCHCKHCQKDTGSAHAANLFSSSAKLNWLQGNENVKAYVLTGTRHAKAFCQVCGSALPSLQLGGKLLVVPAGALDTALKIKPNAHLFMASRAGWDHDLEHVQKFDQLPK